MTTAPLLEVRGLSTRLATARGTVHALRDVTFSLAPGEAVGIVGESGSGKSMLVRTVMGLLPRNASTSGSVRFEGEEVNDLPRSRRRRSWGTGLAMVFQDPMTSLNPTRKVGRQLTDPLRRHLGLSRREAEHRAVELLEQVRVPDAARRLRQFPHELSGGMRQRVMIAIAVSCRPRVLLADEPTTALDVTVQSQVLDLLADLRAELGMTLVLISHDLGVVSGVADRVLVMYAGRVVEASGVAEVFSDPCHPYTVGLLGAIPRLDAPSRQRLDPIAGRPPDLAEPVAGCSFAPRCARASDRCRTELPELGELGAGHRAACHHPVARQEA